MQNPLEMDFTIYADAYKTANADKIYGSDFFERSAFSEVQV